MFTICSIASSCPTIMRRKPDSSCVASRPVLPGSRGMLSRIILSTAFREPLKEPVCLVSPLQKFSSKPSVIYKMLLTACEVSSLPLRAAAFRRSHFYSTFQRSRRHHQEHFYPLGNIFGPNFPVLASA